MPTSGGGAMTRITVQVDGSSYTDDVEPRTLLVHYLREQLGKTGTVVGCDTGNCGACTVHLDGRSVKSCSMLAVQADGHEVTTIEGLATNGQLHPMQQAFHENHALQCGYCTPGMIMQSIDLIADNPNPTEDEIRLGLEGNLCRCTGYQNIVRAVQAAAGEVRNDHHRGTPGRRDRQSAPAQGGRPADHRPDPLDRQHRTARHAAPRDGPQPVRPRADHRHRHRGRTSRLRRGRRTDRRRPGRRAGRAAVRLGRDT